MNSLALACTACGAMIAREYWERHVRFHAWLDDVAAVADARPLHRGPATDLGRRDDIHPAERVAP